MSEVSTVWFSLPPDVEQIARQAVADGEYATIEDVVAEAVLEWSGRRGVVTLDDEAIRKLLDEGIASGPDVDDSMDDIKREARGLWDATQRRAG